MGKFSFAQGSDYRVIHAVGWSIVAGVEVVVRVVPNAPRFFSNVMETFGGVHPIKSVQVNGRSPRDLHRARVRVDSNSTDFHAWIEALQGFVVFV